MSLTALVTTTTTTVTSGTSVASAQTDATTTVYTEPISCPSLPTAFEDIFRHPFTEVWGERIPGHDEGDGWIKAGPPKPLNPKPLIPNP